MTDCRNDGCRNDFDTKLINPMHFFLKKKTELIYHFILKKKAGIIKHAKLFQELTCAIYIYMYFNVCVRACLRVCVGWGRQLFQILEITDNIWKLWLI